MGRLALLLGDACLNTLRGLQVDLVGDPRRQASAAA